MDANYGLNHAKVLAEFDRLAIEQVKQLKEPILYVRAIFQKYGITSDNCKPGVPLRTLISPQSPLEQECADFDKAEEIILAAINSYKGPLPVKSAMCANIEMMYFDSDASFETINQTVTPSLH